MLCYKVKGNKISILPPPLSLLCLVSLTLIVCIPRSGNVTYVKENNEAPNTDLSFEYKSSEWPLAVKMHR
jgi:hypothetical protein